VEFTYRLTGTGWSEARLAHGSNWTTITASYLGDALGDLLEALGVLLEGAAQARCSWEDEPGEYRWLFERTDSDVHLRVLAFPDQYAEEPDDQGKLLFEAQTPLREMAEAIADGAQSVLNEYGEDEYLRQWKEHPFPVSHLKLIQGNLGW
jgi:hypothetical protein